MSFLKFCIALSILSQLECQDDAAGNAVDDSGALDFFTGFFDFANVILALLAFNRIMQIFRYDFQT